ncbi:MAG: PEP-CTERM sorting domain-containing protein [Fimbriimonadaceae bacterium]
MNRILAIAAGLAVVSASHALVIGTGEPSETNAWYGGVLFDVQATGTLDLVLTGDFNIDIDTDATGTYRFYTKPGTFVGSENSIADWTLWGEQTVTGNGNNNWTPLSLGSTQTVNAGETMGIAIFHVGGEGIESGQGALGYKGGGDTYIAEGAALVTGAAKPYSGSTDDPFATFATFSPRTWSGQLTYEAVPEPATMLALGAGLALLARKRRK